MLYCIADALQAFFLLGPGASKVFQKLEIDASGNPLHLISTDQTVTSHPLDLPPPTIPGIYSFSAHLILLFSSFFKDHSFH